MAVVAVAALTLMELRRPLRPQREPKLRRVARNAGVGALSGLTVLALEQPLIARLCRTVALKRWGVLQRVPIPRGLRIALGIALLDYTLYVWHVMTHKVPLLWRFHQAHHADLDLDASTALRFHFGEMALSVPFRAVQVALLGIDSRTYAAWQRLLIASILFHHSNLRLPKPLEQRLARVLMTPRLHGIHHSTIEAERNSNWSSGLTWWDILHGTLQFDVPQEAIEIGIATHRSPKEVTLGKVLAMPFVRADRKRNVSALDASPRSAWGEESRRD
ncbi:MAG: fatty acid hydroxylase [Gammaproteobacteria bacterium]|nr:fatty acid hydroxylase [Gammaproteobacteria bacterium]